MGVKVEIIKNGDGQTFPKRGDNVQIHYTGALDRELSQVFDSSITRNKVFETVIGVGSVIKGWDEGVPQLSEGSKALLEITPDYGYGAHGFPPKIPENATLFFEVELLKVTPTKKSGLV